MEIEEGSVKLRWLCIGFSVRMEEGKGSNAWLEHRKKVRIRN